MFEGLFNFANVSNHLVLIGIYVILALSLNLINGSLGVFSLGHHAFWGMGAYAAGIVVWTGGSLQGSATIFVLSFVAAVLAAGVFGFIVGMPCLRLRGDYLAIATLGFGEIFATVVRNSQDWTIFGSRGLGGKAGFSVGDDFRGGNDLAMSLCGQFKYGRDAFYLVLTWLLVLVTFLIIRNLLKSGFGRAVLAIREDQTAAELMGVNLIRHKVLVFVIGASFAGLAGALSANYRSSISPDQFPMMEGIKILLMIVLGGLGSMSGAVVAAIILYSTEQALGGLDLGGVGTNLPFAGFSNGEFHLVYMPVKELWQVLFPLVLIVLMQVWPRGLTGGREFTREYFGDVLKNWVSRFVRWRAHPLAPIITFFQWAQLLYALPKSEQISQDNSVRVGIITASLTIFVACHVVKRFVCVQHPIEGEHA